MRMHRHSCSRIRLGTKLCDGKRKFIRTTPTQQLQILTNTGAALIIKISETVEALPTAGAISESAFTGLGERAFGHDGSTDGFVAYENQNSYIKS